MPFIKIKTNVSVSKETEKSIVKSMGEAISLIPGKSESWLMVEVEDNCSLYFQGNDAPASIVEISIFGSASGNSYEDLTAKITDIINQKISIDKQRIYTKYSEINNWGWNGSNF